MQTLVKGSLEQATSKSYYDVDILPSSSNFSLGSLSASQYLERYKGWVFSCVSVIATSVACLDRQVSKNGKKVEDHPVTKLMTFDVLEAVASFLKLSGRAYIWKIKVGKEVLGLKVLRPDKITAKMSSNGKRVLHYAYHNGNVKATFKPNELIVLQNFWPKGAYGDIQAAAIAIDTDNAASTWNRKFFENDASAGTVLQTTQKMNKDQLERVEQKRLNKHKWVNNRGKLAILHGGLQIANANPSQKEMDFVQQRGLSRDEILAIFKVPKAMLGMGEGVNVWNVQAFSVIFAKNVLLPLSIKISEAITNDLLTDGYVFEFTGVVPANKDQARSDWISRAISLNEYRRIIGEEPRKGGDDIFYWDDLYSGDPEVIEVEPEKGSKATLKVNKKMLKALEDKDGNDVFSQAIIKAALWTIKGTDDALEVRRNTIIKRMDKHELTYKKQLAKIFARQRKDIMDYIDTLSDDEEKSIKGKKPPKWGKNKYLSLWLTLMRKPQRRLIEIEGQAAIKEVDSDATFKLDAPTYNKRQDKNLAILSTGVDLYTADQVSKIILAAETNGVSVRQLKAQMASMFKDLSTKRINTIVRTETIKLGSYAQDQARQQSGVVDQKQRYTAIDERVCPYCNTMHGKKINLGATFFKKGDSMTVAGAGTIKLDYESIKWPPIHPNCRCTLLPVINDITDA